MGCFKVKTTRTGGYLDVKASRNGGMLCTCVRHLAGMHGEHRGQVPPHRAGTRLAAGVEPVRGGRGRIFKCRMGSTIDSYIIFYL